MDVNNAHIISDLQKNLHSACKTIKKTHFRGNYIKGTRFIERRLVKVG